VGLWADQVLPRVIDRQLSRPEIDVLRRSVCAGLHGDVVEVGFGSGLNVPFYPRAVTRVVAVDPSALAWSLARRRVAASHTPVLRGGSDGQQLTQPDASADCVLTTFSLCTVPDPGRTLEEAGRVLRPGGTIHFLEHGISPDRGVARWQRFLDPLQGVVAGGCHLTRPIDRLVEDAGFVVGRLDTDYLPGPDLNRPFAYTYLGVARKAA
jgi:SAM-dependent methyltransferase